MGEDDYTEMDRITLFRAFDQDGECTKLIEKRLEVKE